ncbi:hypothetical protein FPV67DRAFT_890127 [Lyophyllum atratum]|nr:hypothetical protein FPV67DRAFT_890127 [Lyophyllum atratum]
MSAPIASTSTVTVDIEAQTSLPAPTPVLTYTSRTPPTLVSERSPLDDYFGYTLSASRTHESRHDLSATEALPPYVEDLPPTYALKAPEPLTLARYLFKFGFLFPPFWIMGAWILLSPLQAPSDEIDVEGGWMADKTDAERKRVLEEMRKTEVRWAKRCLWALIVLVLLAAVGGIAAWAVMRS